jgi:hypothetical protein
MSIIQEIIDPIVSNCVDAIILPIEKLDIDTKNKTILCLNATAQIAATVIISEYLSGDYEKVPMSKYQNIFQMIFKDAMDSVLENFERNKSE